VHKFQEGGPSVFFFLIFRSKINVEDTVQATSREDSDGENSPSVSFPSPTKLKGNRSRKLDFPLDDQQPSTSVFLTISRSDNNQNNNIKSVDSITENSESSVSRI
jgi:hypothetical protein